MKEDTGEIRKMTDAQMEELNKTLPQGRKWIPLTPEQVEQVRQQDEAAMSARSRGPGNRQQRRVAAALARKRK